MLYTETITPAALELLTVLMQDKQLKTFVLVGDTALTLQIGHRLSADFDLFTDIDFNAIEFSEYLQNEYSFKADHITKNTVKGVINEIKLDCIAYKYPLIDSMIINGFIRLASLKDIVAMKLSAIVGDGSRLKDFIDIAYTSKLLSLNDMCNAFEQKYGLSKIIPLKALLYFDDINFDEPIYLLHNKKFSWDAIEQQLYKMINTPNAVFPEFE